MRFRNVRCDCFLSNLKTIGAETVTELLTAAQMRAVESAAIESGAVIGLELMERAGQGVVDAIFAQWPALAPGAAPQGGPAPAPPRYLEREKTGRRAVVLCGPGNNGGDGFVVARLLRDASWAVEVFLYGDAGALPPDARVNYERWAAMGAVQLLNFPKPSEEDEEKVSHLLRGATTDVTLCVDALFGTGLTRPLFGLKDFLDVCDLAHAANLNDDGPYVVAVDLPSGLCADSGRIIGDDSSLAVGAHLTVTFAFAKLGHVLSRGGVSAARLVTVPLGINRPLSCQVLHQGKNENGAIYIDHSTAVTIAERWWFEAGEWSNLPWIGKDPQDAGHKYSDGHALILSGGVGHGGAARLAARGALRIGAGAVTVGCPPAALIENAAQLNAVMLRKVKDAGDLSATLQDPRINALCLGPGMGTGAREAALVRAALAAGRSTVLDADALTLLSQDADLFAALHGKCVLTPHAGEFARLFPDISEKLNAPAMTGPAYSKVDATREAAQRAGCTVLFKGPDTVIADPSGRCCINAAIYDRSAPWLATAGAGDVLAGFITGLLARGFAPMQAAQAMAWLHVECARAFGPGLIAEDLPEALPGVLRDLGM